MLDVKNAISAVRGFTGTKVTDPENYGEQVFVSKLLPKVAEFIALEKDEIRNLTTFMDRLDSFSKAVPSISFEGGTIQERAILERECLFDPEENILSLTLNELTTLINDFELQIRGSSREVGTDGFLDDKTGEDQSDEAFPPINPISPKHDITEDVESDQVEQQDRNSKPEKNRDQNSSPSTWRDSVNSKEDDDFERGPGSEDWRKSLDIQAFDSGVDDSWRFSIGNDRATDEYISRAASTEFDDLTKGDTHGYTRSLFDKLKLAEAYLQEVRIMSDYFNYILKPALGFESTR